MKIKSSPMKKLEKIHDGSIFMSPYIFIRELIQNASRAKSSTLHITQQGDQLIFEDDGCGCSTPEHLLTLDESNWQSTDEGFGIGFWSCLAIPKIQTITVQSGSWSIELNADSIFNDHSLDIHPQSLPTETHGFYVCLHSPWLEEHLDSISQHIQEESQYISFPIYFNQQLISQQDLLQSDTFNYDHQLFSNRQFRAHLGIDPYSFSTLDVYYEGRKVTTLYKYSYLKGIIDLKPNSVHLREPDRTSFVEDSSYYRFLNKIEQCAKSMYSNFIKHASNDMLNQFEEAIANWLDPNQYKNILDWSECLFEENSSADDSQESSESIQTIQEIVRTKFETIPHQPLSSNPSDSESLVLHSFNSHEPSSPDLETELLSKEHLDNCSLKELKQMIRKKRFCVWIDKKRYSDFQDYIQELKYKGFIVFISPTKLHDQIFKSMALPCAADMYANEKNFLETSFSIRSTQPKTDKEQIFLQLLQYVCTLFHLPPDTFQIADLSKEMTFTTTFEHRIRFCRQVTKNTAKNVTFCGLCDRSHIYLERRALQLKRFPLKSSSRIGKHEFHAIMYNSELIAHELAHLLFGTHDKTVKHYECEDQIRSQIIQLFIALQNKQEKTA